jgi:DNA-directed RNA polymerase subunit RPC12/RpoP
MFRIGEVKRAWEIGYQGHGQFVFAACVDCGKTRWIGYKDDSKRCRTCSGRIRAKRGPDSHNWKGGRIRSKNGYIWIRLQPDDFFYPMAHPTASQRGYVLEHRLVVAKALNRCLSPWEIVHHKGVKYHPGSVEDKGDNRYPENLQLLDNSRYHIVDTLVKSHIKRLERRVVFLEGRVTLLEADNVILRSSSPAEDSLVIKARKGE